MILANYTFIVRAPIKEIEVKSGTHMESTKGFLNINWSILSFFDSELGEPEYRSYPYIYLKYIKEINGVEYHFISTPMQITKETFYGNIVSLDKSEIIIYANPDNLMEYEFEIFIY